MLSSLFTATSMVNLSIHFMQTVVIPHAVFVVYGHCKVSDVKKADLMLKKLILSLKLAFKLPSIELPFNVFVVARKRR